MKILIATDSFKGSLSSLEAGNAIADGIRRAGMPAEIQVSPIADGGEGTTEALVNGLSGYLETVTVSDPLGRNQTANYGILPSGTAVMEMAAAAGLPLLSESERNPLYTTTFGVGEMIADAIAKGCRKFIIGIGGSATNDGGVGCLQALGFSFRNADNTEIPCGAVGLSQLQKITAENVLPELSACTFQVACDVTNPLCGEQGCSAIFAPQKGADAAMIPQMDEWLSRYAKLTKMLFPESDPNCSGSGAAGGLGFALKNYLHAELESGIQIVMRETQLEQAIVNADLVITGEGKLDAQSIMGKAPIGIAALAKQYQKPVLAFCGCTEHAATICNVHGIDAFFPILREITTLENALYRETARQNLTDTAEQVFRLIRAMR